ncbi:MAG: transketolase family protein [Thermoplasmatales archaeon]|nr:transketolase family protein [Thermoplasmatales archaeon]
MTERLVQRNYYGKALAELARTRKDVVVLDADLADSTKTSEFRKVAPERFVEVGIAEQNMIGVASGLAASGKTVFASTFAVFATGRCWEQIRLSVAYPKLNVKIVATHCGISVGEDGASHQALEDISLMRSLPNVAVVSPADAHQAYAATFEIADREGPCYMRMGRSEVPVITGEGDGFEIGKAYVVSDGSDVTLFGTGQMVHGCIEAAKILGSKSISAQVVNVSTIKPMDVGAVLKAAKSTGCAVTAEEHSVIGGLGSAVAECLVEGYPVPMERVGTMDTFGESGTPRQLFEKYGLTPKDIAAAAERAVARKSRD